MEEQWIERLRGKLENYSSPVPQGLWSDVERSLQQRKAPPVLLPLRRRVALWAVCAAGVAAAVLLALVVGGFVPTMPQGGNESSVLTSASCTAKPSSEIKSPHTGHEPGAARDAAGVTANTMKNTAVTYLSGRSAATLPPTKAVCPGIAVGDSVSAGTTAETVLTAQVEAGDGGRGSHATQPTSAHAKAVQDAPALIHSQRNGTRNVAASTASHSRLMAVATPHGGERLSISVSAANLAATSRSNPGYGTLRAGTLPRGLATADNAFGMTSAVRVMLANGSRDVSTRKRHKLPVRAGLTVRYRITPRLGVESGVTYSYLTSELMAGSSDHRYETHQSLHYIGVPLNVSYTVWGNSRWEVYASAGGVVEKCVSGKAVTDYVIDGEVKDTEHSDARVKPLQWSLNAAAGVQFNIVRRLGVYAEPGVAYYFNNGSKVETIYKDKPFNFNLRAGLRYSF